MLRKPGWNCIYGLDPRQHEREWIEKRISFGSAPKPAAVLRSDGQEIAAALQENEVQCYGIVIGALGPFVTLCKCLPEGPCVPADDADGRDARLKDLDGMMPVRTSVSTCLVQVLRKFR